MQRLVLYTVFNRLWHRSQGVLIILLAMTGFEVRGTFAIFGYARAAYLHNVLALIVLIVFAVFWHVTTGQRRQYIPTWASHREMVAFSNLQGHESRLGGDPSQCTR